ncbi:retrotransposon protein [Cucumis melo var. makuwa]|nr:retrotransposon protein [Cucumis melo var. makuwa]
MASSSRLPKHNWTKEEEVGLVECLVKLVNAGGMMNKNALSQSIVVEKEVFDDWSHLAAKGFINESFLHYDELSYVFGKDPTTEGQAKSFMDVGSNDPAGYAAFVANAASDTNFQPMYSQGLNMSPNELMGTRTDRVSEGRYVLSGSKQKRGGQVVDSGDVIRTAIEYVKTQAKHVKRLFDSWRPSLS